MVLPTWLCFFATYLYMTRRVPRQRIKDYLNIRQQETRIVFDNPRHDVILMLFILLIYVFYHLGRIIFCITDMYTSFLNGGQKHIA